MTWSKVFIAIIAVWVVVMVAGNMLKSPSPDGYVPSVSPTEGYFSSPRADR